MAASASAGFEEETRVFLQERLRAIQGWVAILLVVMTAALIAARTRSVSAMSSIQSGIWTEPMTSARPLLNASRRR